MKQIIFANQLRFILFFLLAGFFSSHLIAQITEDVLPIPVDNSFSVESIQVNFAIHKIEAIEMNALSPPLIGVTTDVDISDISSGSWVVYPELQKKVWLFRIEAEENKGISLYFDRFNPGAEGKFFVFDDLSNVYGAYTSVSNPHGGSFAIYPIPARSLFLQFETDINASDYSISISEVGLLFPEKDGLGFGTSGSCNVNVNCDEGQEWQRQKRGVARIIVKQGSAQFYCTGSLINNTLADRLPYFLTANHCGEFASSTDYTQWTFAFNYESPECVNPQIEPQKQTLTGANLVARAIAGTTNGSDFKLLQLLQDVPLSYSPYFNGWSLQENVTSTGVGIHHPNGDVKKISSYTSQPVSSQYGFSGVDPAAKYWRVQWTPTQNGHGITEGGSSGSPLFDSEGRIIGLLTGGSSSCSNLTGPDFYGKFSAAWTSNGSDPFNQLKPWLDPSGSGIEVLGGLGSDTLFVESDFNAIRTDISIEQFVRFENLSSGTIEAYQWFFEGGQPASSNEENPGQIYYSQYGDFDVKLIVNNPTFSDTLLREDYIRVKPFLFPNPAKDAFEMSFGVDLTNDYKITITNASGKSVPFEARLNGSRLRILLHQAVSGPYVITMSDQFVEKALKLIIVN